MAVEVRAHAAGRYLASRIEGNAFREGDASATHAR